MTLTPISNKLYNSLRELIYRPTNGIMPVDPSILGSAYFSIRVPINRLTGDSLYFQVMRLPKQ